MLTLMTVEQKKAKDKRRQKNIKKNGVKHMKNITKKAILSLSILSLAGAGAGVPVEASQTFKATKTSYYSIYAPNKSYYIFKASSNKKLVGLQYKDDTIEGVKVKSGQYYKVYFSNEDMTCYKPFKPSTSDLKKFNARYNQITKGVK